MKRFLTYHWFWFFTLVCGYSLYDFLEHISRSGSLYEQFAGEWFLFRFSATCTFCFSIYFLSHLFYLTKASRLIADLLAFILAFSLHLYLMEPWWNSLFWPYEGLSVPLTYDLVAIGFMGYIVYRIVFLVVFSVIKKLS